MEQRSPPRLQSNTNVKIKIKKINEAHNLYEHVKRQLL